MVLDNGSLYISYMCDQLIFYVGYIVWNLDDSMENKLFDGDFKIEQDNKIMGLWSW